MYYLFCQHSSCCVEITQFQHQPCLWHYSSCRGMLWNDSFLQQNPPRSQPCCLKCDKRISNCWQMTSIYIFSLFFFQAKVGLYNSGNFIFRRTLFCIDVTSASVIHRSSSSSFSLFIRNAFLFLLLAIPISKLLCFVQQVSCSAQKQSIKAQCALWFPFREEPDISLFIL